MEIALTLKDLGFILIIVCVAVLLINCTCLIRHLITTIKRTNEILADTQVITDIAAERTKEVNEAVGDLAGSVSRLAEAIKGNQSLGAAFSSLVNSFASLKKMVHEYKNSEEE
ncbi:MAG: hypothetical protein ACI4LO_03970 [Anaerovoracaceae bacterium]